MDYPPSLTGEQQRPEVSFRATTSQAVRCVIDEGSSEASKSLPLFETSPFQPGGAGSSSCGVHVTDDVPCADTRPARHRGNSKRVRRRRGQTLARAAGSYVEVAPSGHRAVERCQGDGMTHEFPCASMAKSEGSNPLSPRQAPPLGSTNVGLRWHMTAPGGEFRRRQPSSVCIRLDREVLVPP